ncbi:sensor domain-containing diguanylate cyclase/phosphohydrolase [Halanaerobacter jeridensis]|uniref:Diguanylate cyclase (GGDEF)-like protein/PAS domain S-box-containing protein n=1 Tax=Halanaerobacter jeridensis TaxID=706427 RepID=A0A939BNL8_9FIRM|nr:HD domain-containing phosphohydrolase [Halanaerobacter jeridensis]MBM7555712.1 diguanylate cyclase (GGDEF)-like protein/PAS domain S-box-containing protein [Halanaerobacter jeridensis]
MNKYEQLFIEAPIGIFRTNDQGEPLSVNKSLAKMLGCANEEEVLEYYTDLSEQLYVNSQRRIDFINQLKEKKEVNNFEYQARRSDGEEIWLSMDARIGEVKSDGSFVIEGFVIDITEMKVTKEELEKKKEALETFFNVTPDLLGIIDIDGNFIKVNQAWEKNLGYSKEKLEKSNCFDYIHPADQNDTKRKLKRLKNKEEVLNFVNRYRNSQGEYRYLEWRARWKNGFIYAASRDVTKRKKQEDKIKYISFHDNLTNLYNRTYLEEEIERMDVERQLPISLIMADLNGLKVVNDTYGHDRGDEILKQTAKILKTACRQEDVIARWGGDEFVIFLPQTREKEAQKVYNRIKNLCAATDGNEIPISIALGIGVKNNLEQKIYDVLNVAEEQMYKNKLDESRSTKSHIVKALLKTLGEKSDETEEHAWRMQKLTFLMAEELDLSQAKMDKLSLVATLHDIGKTIIPAEILTKTAKLTEDEWDTIQQHPKTGYRIASSTEEFSHVAEKILYHHERWDGSGYPHGLKGEGIPLLSRIITIVDAYDVMTNGRPYKDAMTKKEALAELERCSGTQFDPQLVNHFIKVMS